jgi:hypothetical protein
MVTRNVSEGIGVSASELSAKGVSFGDARSGDRSLTLRVTMNFETTSKNSSCTIRVPESGFGPETETPLKTAGELGAERVRGAEQGPLYVGRRNSRRARRFSRVSPRVSQGYRQVCVPILVLLDCCVCRRKKSDKKIEPISGLPVARKRPNSRVSAELCELCEF